MRLLLPAALALLPLAAQAADTLSPGTYYCITDRMVGIQPQTDPAAAAPDRIAGPLTPRTLTFVVRIDKLAEAECTPSGGQSKDLAKDLSCRPALWVAKLPDDKADLSATKLTARDTPTIFQAGTTVFWITPEGSYSLARLFGAKGNSVEEGRCQTFEW